MTSDNSTFTLDKPKQARSISGEIPKKTIPNFKITDVSTHDIKKPAESETSIALQEREAYGLRPKSEENSAHRSGGATQKNDAQRTRRASDAPKYESKSRAQTKNKSKSGDQSDTDDPKADKSKSVSSSRVQHVLNTGMLHSTERSFIFLKPSNESYIP